MKNLNLVTLYLVIFDVYLFLARVGGREEIKGEKHQLGMTSQFVGSRLTP